MNYEDMQPEETKGRTLVTVGMDGKTVISNVEPIPGMEVCDFCSAPDPTYVFETEAETSQEAVGPDGEPVTFTNSKNWASCGRCAIFIRANDRQSLAERSLKQAKELHPELANASEAGLAEVAKGIWSTQALFFSVWKGGREG